MRVEELKIHRQIDFVNYCRKHRDKLDDSFLIDDELNRFEIGEENPTYVLLNDEGKIIGASSLYKSDYYRRGSKARFRLLHSEINDISIYRELFGAALKHVDDLERLIIFCPESTVDLKDILIGLGFQIERYAFILNREDMPVSDWSFPKGYELRTFQYKKDEEDWCKARNAAFANHLGSETPATPEMLSKSIDWEDNIEGGMMMLYHKSEPVGVLRVAKELKNNEYYTSIDLLGLIPEHQRMGLGRNLLRLGISYGTSKGMKKATLAANAENQKAVDLYLSEGFLKELVLVGYNYKLK